MVRKYKRYHVMCALVLGLMMVVPATAKLDLSDDDCSLHTDQLADCVKQPFITIRAIETRTQGDNGMLGWDYRFPFAEGYGIAATNINIWLQSFWLDSGGVQHEPGMFAHLVDEHGLGTTRLDYHENPSVSSVLSLTVLSEYIFASINENEGTFTFNRFTGMPVVLDQLLNAQGITKMAENVRRAREARIDAFLRQVTPDEEIDGQFIENQKALYANCRPNVAQVRDDTLELRPDGLLLRLMCADRRMSNLAALDPLENTFTYELLAPDMTAYGRCLLLEQRNDCVPDMATLAPGVWHGHIGAYPATFIIHEFSDNDNGKVYVNAVYFYDRYQTLIRLNAQYEAQNNKLILHVSDSGAVMTLSPTVGGGWAGRWQAPQESGGRSLDVSFQFLNEGN